MNRFRRFVLQITVLGAVATFVTGCVGFFDKVADKVLANEVRFDDREAPRTPHMMAASVDGVQIAGGQGKGLSCSLPPFAQALAFHKTEDQAPIALQMRQACAFHDYCYRHGSATYGYSQADCDFTLQQQAFRLCKFINGSKSISDCETDARKVTLGVRLGGSGNFQGARTLDDSKASTFLEFDPYPVRATSYQVVRIADAPRQWVLNGLLPKAAYHFDVRPSGSLVYIIGWKSGGAMVCTSFKLPGSYDAINGPPMVVRDAPGGEDWFVWWKRAKLSATHGHFALLPPGRATREDWVNAAGGLAPDPQAAQCEHMAAWNSGADALPAAQPLGFVTRMLDLEFSELHPVHGADTPGFVRLMGLSTHSCNKVDRSLCLVDVEFDTALRQFRKEPLSPAKYRAVDYNCAGKYVEGRTRDDCDRYRNYVGAPYVIAHARRPSLVWMRRGAGNGDGYEDSATVLHYTVGKTRDETATDLGELHLTGFPESREPAFITNTTTVNPVFVSVVAGSDGFRLLAQAAVPRGKESRAVALDCFPHADNSWLQRPPALVPDRRDPSRSYIVFSRVRIGEMANPGPLPAAALELVVATLANGACSGVTETSFAHYFDGFAAPDEVTATASANNRASDAREAIGRFAARVRGGQTVLADVTGDGIPDLVQVAKVPQTSQTVRLRSALLVGRTDSTGLTFHEIPGSRP